MANQGNDTDALAKRLDAIHSVLLDLLIIQGQSAGLTKNQVREIAGVSHTRVSKTWKLLKISKAD